MAEIDLSRSNEELARQFLEEHPEGSETFDGPYVQLIVYGIGSPKDPARYAEICRLARGMTESVERQATCMLEEVNGLRRVRGEWDMPTVLVLLDEVRPLIDQVTGERQRRLREVHAYHAGLVHREAGRFEEAAKAQDEAASLAPDPATAAISRFCAAVELAHHALQVGDETLIREKLGAVLSQSEELLNVSVPEDHPKAATLKKTLTRWQLADRPAHLLYLHWLAGEEYDDWNADLDSFLNKLPADLAEQYTVWRHVFSAISAVDGKRLDEAAAFAHRAIGLDVHAATTALAMVVLADVAEAEGLLGVQKAYLRGIVSLPGHGGHFVREVAEQELADLEAAGS